MLAVPFFPSLWKCCPCDHSRRLRQRLHAWSVCQERSRLAAMLCPDIQCSDRRLIRLVSKTDGEAAQEEEAGSRSQAAKSWLHCNWPLRCIERSLLFKRCSAVRCETTQASCLFLTIIAMAFCPVFLCVQTPQSTHRHMYRSTHRRTSAVVTAHRVVNIQQIKTPWKERGFCDGGPPWKERALIRRCWTVIRFPAIKLAGKATGSFSIRTLCTLP